MFEAGELQTGMQERLGQRRLPKGLQRRAFAWPGARDRLTPSMQNSATAKIDQPEADCMARVNGRTRPVQTGS
jgi:hypothetical protein